MAIDKSRYIARFIDEVGENITASQSLVIALESDDDAENLGVLLRHLHTIKGSARMLEFKNIESLSHAVESVFIAYKEGRIKLKDKGIKLILSAFDLLRESLKTLAIDKTDSINVNVLVSELKLMAENEEFNLPAATKIKALDTKEHGKEKISKNTIRISLEKINGIIRDIAAQQSIEVSSKTLMKTSRDLAISLQAYARSQPKNSAISELLSNANRLSNSAKNLAADCAVSVKNFYDAVVSLRMVPLSTILDNYTRFVFDMSASLGKQADVEIVGKENEIDKHIIELLGEIFLHIIRNAIDHGIEKPSDRIKLGKTERGKIVINCSRESGNMKITISDDGRGIDYAAIRTKIVENNIMDIEAANALDTDELNHYMFQSGFSTAKVVSDISGRGVGMDVVAANVEQVKGVLFVESTKNIGTKWTIIVPLSFSSITGFPIMSGSRRLIVPVNYVEAMFLLNTDDIISVVDRPAIAYNNKIIKLYYIDHLLDTIDIKTDRDSYFVAIMRDIDDLIAICVDNVEAMRSVIVKPLPKTMHSFSLYAGVVLSEDYEMVPILHIPTLSKIAKQTKAIDMKSRAVDREQAFERILVVDDSTFSRDIICDILRSDGFIVDGASDGSQALNLLKERRYDLVCSDINMPNIDGWTLARNIRDAKELKDIPIVFITSRSDQADIDRAKSLGVDRYIVKNSFKNKNLITVVRELIK
ncbi:hybrid sensor histidine kinase/response regulator [Campylobacterota bacterium]|nr:hybrid sensor histidine kinase/response regulator [Campylobacterota bacterium]